MGNDFTASKKSGLLYEPSLRAKRMPPNESIVARTDDDVVVVFKFDCTYNVLPFLRVPIYAPKVASEGNLID
jgi:hypothetical protein